MFTANQTAIVPGRIVFLIVPVKTINGIRIEAVPLQQIK